MKVAGVQRGSSWILHVLAGHTLQQWLLAQGELQTLMYECDVNKLAVDAFLKTVWVFIIFLKRLRYYVFIDSTGNTYGKHSRYPSVAVGSSVHRRWCLSVTSCY